MKNFTVRAFVLTLALTGAVASTVSSKAATKSNTTKVTFLDPSTPAPMCSPKSASLCGID
ncbi:hypothetical protein ACFQBQ_14095 [Granulicella cerasi]|uniref:Uncharacterized protein n=1 Tax=Granulicella cerasi TaxID=741063 RepID=A0ABW1ZB51_9BACT|nr:hypothetical protein [Granulicella cerasi]